MTSLRGALASLMRGAGTPEGVRGAISESWLRSAAAGLDPLRLDVPYGSDTDDDGERLQRAAKPVLDHLAEDLDGSRVGVLLTDATGRVLYRKVRDRQLRDLLDRINLAPGFVYAEDRVGTNALGTALAQEATAVVNGEEHFADALVGMASAAAPVRDPGSGKMLGAVGVASCAEEANKLMLPLARQAVRQVESRLVDARPGFEHGWAGLSKTESKVAELVAQGCTNRETGERLLMSRHTVDFHLRSIFRKLRVGSRVELARLAERNRGRGERMSRRHASA